MNHVLITGGAGFLGHHLCGTLLKKGAEVICVDNLISGSKDNIRKFFTHPYFEFIRHDITHPLYVEVDRIFNLACPASPIHYQYNAIKTIKTNVIGTINMLGLAKRTKARILQASTSEIYGLPEVHPQPETYRGSVNPIGMRSCYDEGKRVAETLMMDYHRQNQVDIRIARIFNTYGPGMAVDDGRVVSNLIIQALKGQPLTVYGDGNQTRSFCYVDDMIEGILTLMEVENLFSPVNIGNTEECSVLELAELIIKLTKSRSRIAFQPKPEDDPKRRCPDTSLAEKKINWKPQVSLEDGMARTVEYFRQKLDLKP